MNKKIKWGILGPGRIAKAFAGDFKYLKDAELYAVGSRSIENANRFGDEYNILKRYGSYSELAKDSEIDIIYIATPHNSHKEYSLLCLNNGKSVLCEKPMTVNSIEAQEVVVKAKEKNLFYLDGMWSRFLPVYKKVKELINNNEIGKIKMLSVDFGFYREHDPNGRVLNPDLAGGALLDVGIYPISFASMIFGRQPQKIKSFATFSPTGVDVQDGMVFQYENGEIATIQCAVQTDTQKEAHIIGTDGFIKVISPFFKSTQILLSKNGNEYLFDLPYEGSGFHFEANEAMNCILNDRIESELLPHNESVDIMKTLDRIREEWGFVYPFEKSK